jgi:hypothetical protein
VSQSQFARDAQLDRSSMNKILRGKGPRSRFSVEESKRIVAATGGNVTFEDCLLWEHKGRKR